ncbi:MAG: DNA polymerase III subunit chi [Paracoccus sp. (in: a-proteobacteria)]|nr:DNA polymerase III subunit chi [Paracoccus sp. (in: a-proteobacteria)]
MGKVLFYHLTRSAAEQLVPVLIARSREQGWRVELRGRDPARLEALDRQLWAGEGFLPHGLAGGPHDARQPVLLRVAEAERAANNPDCLVAIDGAEVGEDELAGLSRICILFDGNDSAALDHARAQWRALTGAGAEAEYWSEESGRWQKKR